MLVGATNEEKIWNFFQSKGLNDYACAGILGNANAESGLKPDNLQDTYQRKLNMTDEEYTRAVDNETYNNFIYDAAGYGIFQFTFWSRKRDILNYARTTNRSIGDLEMQLEYAWLELTESYPSVLNTLKNATSVKQASDVFMVKFESPADQSESAKNKRASYGQKYYDKYATNNIVNDIQNNYVNEANTVAFKMRTTKPEAGNKYYITKARGGYSNAIQGKPVDPNCDVLSNCVGYAYGRFNEIGGYGYCKYLSPVNAEKFMQYKGSLSTGQTPQVGACMVWRKGATLNGSDGAGHVAIVEKVVSPTQVITSESAYGGKAFYTQTRNKGAGNWGMGNTYTFLGFIYNPAVSGTTTTISTATTPSGSTILRYGNSGNAVKELQENLIKLGYSCGSYGADGSFGMSTENAVRKFQKNNNLVADGVAGTKTLSAINEAVSKSNIVKIKITASLLNVRAGAGTNYKVLTTVKKDSTHDLLEEKNGWGRISKGWISSTYYKKL